MFFHLFHYGSRKIGTSADDAAVQSGGGSGPVDLKISPPSKPPAFLAVPQITAAILLAAVFVQSYSAVVTLHFPSFPPPFLAGSE